MKSFQTLITDRGKNDTHCNVVESDGGRGRMEFFKLSGRQVLFEKMTFQFRPG